MVQKSGEKTRWYGESAIIYRVFYISSGDSRISSINKTVRKAFHKTFPNGI